jgi:hypothetical protein
VPCAARTHIQQFQWKSPQFCPFNEVSSVEMATIGLCLIVKNEAHVIVRCLDSVRPLVDYVLVVDTGSSDQTQQIIEKYLDENSIPGQVISQPWRNFAENRTAALGLLRMNAAIDYALMIDADETLVCEPGFSPAKFKSGLAHDLYDIATRFSNCEYDRPQLISNRVEFFFKGALHEFLVAPEGASRGKARGLHNVPLQDSARNQNPEKFRHDAQLLEQLILTETDPFLVARYTFYLAQSYRDCGEPLKAMARYLERARMGFWHQEVFISLYYAAGLKEAALFPDEDVIGTYLLAYQECSTRAESLHAAACFCRRKNKHQLGYLIARDAMSIARPADGLFVESWVYDYGILDEFAVHAYWSGHYQECVDACRKLLSEAKFPAEYEGRIRDNEQFARDKLVESNTLPTCMSEIGPI